MIARFHYDDKTLAQLLLDEPADSSDEIAEHVETCEQCQSRLETITQDGLTWDEAASLLKEDPLDELTGVSLDASDVKTSTAFLEPSDHPGSLGRFGRYEIMELLGRGGMGIVMRGFDPALNRHSAVKVLAPELASSAAARKRFSREAKSAAAVVHPHVVPIQTVDEHGGLPYLVMPVVEGRSLQQRVDQNGPLPVVEAVRIAAQIAEGLAAAHAQGLVHRDIKPANILLENGVERVQITDFGLARAADDASMTRSGVIAGTPQYMSPEQAHGDEIDHRSDLFSLGSVMYFMLTGRSPFRAENTMGVLNRIANDEPRRLRSIQPEIPIWFDAIVVKLLEKDPEKRFSSARATSEELNRRLAQLQDPSYQEHEPKSATYQGIPPTIKWIAVAGAAMASVFYLAIVLLQTKDGTIRIETNGDLATSVPLVIKQGDEVVERLTVDSDGATTRVRAGSYSIEFEGDSHSFELVNNNATVKAGGEWTTKIQYQLGEASKNSISANAWKASNDPDVIRSLAVEDTRFSRHEASLEKILWCWDNAVNAKPAWSAVRRSFLLSDWLELADVYPPALVKLISIRDELEERVLSKDQVRVRADDFADVAAINTTLRQEHRTIDLFDKIKMRDSQDAERVKYYLPKSGVRSVSDSALDDSKVSDSFDISSLPSNTQVHVLGCYMPQNQSTVEVHVEATGTPMLIVLTSYFSAKWHLHLDEDADVRGVLLAGYYEPSMSSVQPSVPLVTRSYFPVWDGINADEKKLRHDACFYVWSPLDPDFSKMSRIVKELTGRMPNTFQGSYIGADSVAADGSKAFVIDGTSGVVEYEIALQCQSWFSNPSGDLDDKRALIQVAERTFNDTSIPKLVWLKMTVEMFERAGGQVDSALTNPQP